MDFDWNSILTNIVYPGIYTALIAIFGVATAVVRSFIVQWFKDNNFRKGNAVVEECILQSMDALAKELKKDFADGHLSDEEEASLKKLARDLAESKLKRLYGFYKKDMIGWIDERIDSTLPKLISPRVKAFVSKHL